MNKEASIYDDHRSLQAHDTKKFLSLIASMMDSTLKEEDVVMDIGCGPGSSILKLLLPSVPDVGKIVAVDVLPSMIEYAKTANAHPKVEYYVGSIEDRPTIECWKGQMTKIYSFFVFHWLTRLEEGFQNTYDLLKPGGEAAVLFVLKCGFWNSLDAHVKNPKWRDYLENVDQHVPASNFRNDCSSFYKDMMERIGFEVAFFEVEEREFTFEDDEVCKDSLVSICPQEDYIPEELKKEFIGDLFEGFLKHNPRNADEKPKMIYTTLGVLLRKPGSH